MRAFTLQSWFLTFGIIAINLETCEYDRQEILKDLQQMVNEVSAKVKALVKSKKAIKEELSRLQKDLENMMEEELQSLDSTDPESTMHELLVVSVEQEHTVGVNTSDLA
ncbi:hypothetical protein SO802_009185 [Lithocarpus litseifolius]|uniref:Uncharacterized protein n=1 Tax=Lithocarpus litseifolius TaxID=425828 RepID=A0AAW2DAR6_9ROSI